MAVIGLMACAGGTAAGCAGLAVIMLPAIGPFAIFMLGWFPHMFVLLAPLNFLALPVVCMISHRRDGWRRLRRIGILGGFFSPVAATWLISASGFEPSGDLAHLAELVAPLAVACAIGGWISAKIFNAWVMPSAAVELRR